MKSIFDITATEIKNILIEKNIAHEFVVVDHGHVWVGVRAKTKFYWLQFIDETTTGFMSVETYSQNTGKTSRGFEERQKVYSRFEKIINN